MSALPLRALRSPATTTLAATTKRTFASSRPALVGKESALRASPSFPFVPPRVNGNLPKLILPFPEADEDQNARAAKIEQHKQDQLKDSQANQGKWRDELASDSESIVKADRGELKDAKGTIQELQRETAKLAEREKREGKE